MELFLHAVVLLVALLFLYLLFRLLRNIVPILLNSIAGIIVFLLLNAFFQLGIPINLLTIAIVGIGGFVGLIIVLFLHFLGIAF